MSVTELEFQASVVEAAPEQAIEGRSQWQLTWRRLRHDKMAVASVVVILIMTVLALLAPVFAAVLHHGEYQAFTGAGLSSAGVPGGPGTPGLPPRADSLGPGLPVPVPHPGP